MAKKLTPWEFQILLKQTVQSGRLADVVRVAMVETGLKAEGIAKLAVTNGGSSGLNARSGALRNSIRSVVKSISGIGESELELSAGGRFGGNDVRYARIHELGSDGPIRPKRAKNLAIPTKEARTAAGVSRVPSPRDFPDLRWAQSKGGQPMLVDESGTPMFILRKSVTIPARPYLRPSLDTAVQGFRARLGTAMARALTEDL